MKRLRFIWCFPFILMFLSMPFFVKVTGKIIDTSITTLSGAFLYVISTSETYSEDLLYPLEEYSAVGDSARGKEIEFMSRIGKGNYLPVKQKKIGEKRIQEFETNFDEFAPGRNSAANEWSAYGVRDGKSFNTFGREMRTRYPIFDLVFLLKNGEQEIAPGDLDSFRMGLFHDNMPAIWTGFSQNGLMYKVTVMCVPDAEGPFDLYKVEIRNISDSPRESCLYAAIDGPPDMRMEKDVVRGLGKAPFIITDKPEKTNLIFRDWGLCDKRAKSFESASVNMDPAFGFSRAGFSGVPVVYRIKAEKSKKYLIFLGSTPNLSSQVKHPEKSGELIYRYEVEGAPSQSFDFVKDMPDSNRPICIRFDNAQDTNGDGYIEIKAGTEKKSLFKESNLSVIYVFPENTILSNSSDVWKGNLNEKCLYHINVGVTPEMSWFNQYYDKSDVGFARFMLSYGGTIAPGETKTSWLKVPPIHRRQHTGMKILSHAFNEVHPGEAVPSYDSKKISYLRGLAPGMMEERVVKYWEDFFKEMAPVHLPDKVITDMYMSRIATRSIFDIPFSDTIYQNVCSPWMYFDFAYRDHAYVVRAYDLAGRHDLAERLLRVYCMDVKDVPLGPLSFGEVPLQMGMNKDGVWITRPGQHDTQGENIWALAEHYKLTGNKEWLSKTAYPYIKRGAMWIVNSRHKHMNEIKDPEDPRYGLIEPGAMEVFKIDRGMHHYYMDAWAVLGLREAAETAQALGLTADSKLFSDESADLKNCLTKSFEKTFRRTGLYTGNLWFGVEENSDGMYGYWGHTPLVWPCGAIDPYNPLLTATFRHMETMAKSWGGGLSSESAGSLWPYIGVDWAISYILRGEREKTLEYFGAYVDAAGSTLSWGEGYDANQNLYAGDQPHFWADAQFISLFRTLFLMEDESTLLVTPALPRRWHEGSNPVSIKGFATYFGDVDLTIQPDSGDNHLIYTIKISPNGDQKDRELSRIVLYPRIAGGKNISSVQLDGKILTDFTRDTVIITKPERGKDIKIDLQLFSK